MSLQIWLPLNGNLENQGLTDIEATNAGATTNANGKIGSCYYFNGTSSRIGFPEIAISYPISICAWIKGETITASGTEYILSYNIPTGGTLGHAIGFGTYTGKLSIWHGGTVHSYGTALTNNVWYHVAAVVTESSYGLYLNGNLVLSGSGTQKAVNSKCITIGARSNNSGGGIAGAAYFFKGFMNDVRIYDHALSAKEVRELAKGLVLHYKLDDVTTATSLISKTATYSIYNNYSVPASLESTDEVYLGSPVRRLTMTPTEARLSNFRSSLANHGIRIDRQTFLANTKYAFWVYYRLVTHKDARVGGVASNIGGWTETPPQYIGNDWYAVGQYRDGSVTSDKTDSIFVSFRVPTAEADVPISIDFACPTLVKDTAEIQPELNYRERHDIVYDSSGFGYNGTPANVETLSGPPRYLKSTHFTGSTSKIHIPNLSTSGFSTTYTFTWWGKTNSWSGKMFWGFSDGTRLNLYNGIYWNTGDGSSDPIYIPGTTTIITAPSLNVWHHYAMVRDNNACLLYLDGVLYGQAKTVKQINGTSIYLNGWDNSGSYTLNDMSMVDFRIYSTALTADDILELYHTSASIDKSGSIYARELVE